VTGQPVGFETSHAVLISGGKFALQLRDDLPTISAPGQWALFGGRKLPTEAPDQTIKREIFEELEIRPNDFEPLWSTDYYDPYEDNIVRTWFYWSDVSDIWPHHKLKEGKQTGLFDLKEINGLDVPSIMEQTIQRFAAGGYLN
jgi:8-oxo-dGTP pyrophosphatase MutT (NUDIX family)